MAKRDKDTDRPPMIPRPIYVEYVAVRRCRFNPSWGNAGNNVMGLWDRWKRRHPRRSLESVNWDVSSPKKTPRKQGKTK